MKVGLQYINTKVLSIKIHLFIYHEKFQHFKYILQRLFSNLNHLSYIYIKMLADFSLKRM